MKDPSVSRMPALAALRREVGALDARLEGRRATLCVAVLASVLAVLVGLPGAVLLYKPDSDGLFYEVQKLELEGHSSAEATAIVFQSPLARQTAAIEDRTVRRILDPAWVSYSSQFYQRRWLVPGMAAAIDPLVGHRMGAALRVASFLGYALLAPALFLLLRRRFTPTVSLGVALAALLSIPVYRWSIGMLSDSWGLLLETLAVLAAVLVKEKGRHWLFAWTAVLLALSITRDASIIVLTGALVLFVVERRNRSETRTNLLLLGSGVLAALPVFLLGGAPVRQNMAYIMSGFRIPRDDSWAFVASHYPRQILNTIVDNAQYPFSRGPAMELILLVTLLGALLAIAVVLLVPVRDFYFVLTKGLVLGCTLFLLIAANPQAYRLELVFAPVCAIGLAILAQRLLAADAPDFRRKEVDRW